MSTLPVPFKKYTTLEPESYDRLLFTEKNIVNALIKQYPNDFSSELAKHVDNNRFVNVDRPAITRMRVPANMPNEPVLPRPSSFPQVQIHPTDHCTRMENGKRYVTQRWYICVDCFGHADNKGVCTACVQKCHRGHAVIEALNSPSAFFCDCGDDPSPCPCNCMV